MFVTILDTVLFVRRLQLSKHFPICFSGEDRLFKNKRSLQTELVRRMLRPANEDTDE
ncbi:hypothetical protein KIN20_032300 [Parelaphostrongylus tenuis]|uniref:Uncharacterized protein n=1 Tax=Parelaphostrongylus tenuis TaxID=148309 RepID=A0AAD5R6D5_PARTN|nr:hypothetical protein KIN20_032300 [Parelaphostrongylus tenuis]